MKKLLLIATLALAALGAQAQTYGSGTNIWGTNNVPINIGAGSYLTNSAYFSVPGKSLTLGNITSTNETVIGWYGFQIPATWQLVPGSTNIYAIGYFTNSFASGTNGGTWSTNIPAIYANINFAGYMGLNVYPYTNSAYVP
jgi:hypothetical protein